MKAMLLLGCVFSACGTHTQHIHIHIHIHMLLSSSLSSLFSSTYLKGLRRWYVIKYFSLYSVYVQCESFAKANVPKRSSALEHSTTMRSLTKNPFVRFHRTWRHCDWRLSRSNTCSLYISQ